MNGKALNANMLYYLFDSTNMHRWNDHLRTLDLSEMDKQAHKTAHHLPAKMQMVSIHSQALQRILQHLPVRSQVKQGSYRHVPADTRITLQI